MSTILQKNRLKTIGKSRTKKQQLLDAGYSASVAQHQPPGVMKGLGWLQLLEKHIPDSKLTAKLDEGLESMKQIGARKIVQGARTGHEIKVDSTTEEEDFIEVPDFAIRHKYLETALKVKGKLIEKKDITSDGEKLEAIQVVIVEDIPTNDD